MLKTDRPRHISVEKPSKAILRNPKARRHWVVFAFQSNGRTLSALAAELGVTRQCLYGALHHPYPRTEKIIAEALGMTAQELFPERYDALGLPNRMKGRPAKKISCHVNKNTPTARAGNTQLAEAA